MRSITDAEARTVRSLLAALPMREGERARQAGVSSRTFERVRRRAYDSRWLYDRYVPNPNRLGFTTATFVLVHPFAEDVNLVLQRMMAAPSNVLTWSWPTGGFGVFWTRSGNVEQIREIAKWRDAGGSVVVSCRAAGESVPVYFDFERAWARWTGQPGVLGYPRGLPTRSTDSPSPDFGVNGKFRLVRALVARPFDSRGEERPVRVSLSLLQRQERRILRTGIVERRTFLNPKEIPPFEGRSLERLAFLTGDLGGRQSLPDLLRALFAMGISPFLAVSDGARVLLGSMSPGPPRPRPAGNTPAVLRTISRYMSNIRIAREPLESISFLVNHRYDHLLGRL